MEQFDWSFESPSLPYHNRYLEFCEVCGRTYDSRSGLMSCPNHNQQEKNPPDEKDTS
jgi:hypothetical protein